MNLMPDFTQALSQKSVKIVAQNQTGMHEKLI